MRLISDIKNGDITPGTLVLVYDGDEVPVDGPVVASSEGMWHSYLPSPLPFFSPLTHLVFLLSPGLASPILCKEAALTGETAPSEKFPVDLGVSISGINPEDTDAILGRYAAYFGKV